MCTRAERVATPSLMLIVTGASGLVLNVIGTAFNLLSLAVPNMAQPRGGGGMHMEVMLSGGFGIVGGLIGVAIGAVVILGGLKMKRLESHAWAMAGAIVAVIPCFSPCCLLGFPFGIWALVVLNDPQVRSAFRA